MEKRIMLGAESRKKQWKCYHPVCALKLKPARTYAACDSILCKGETLGVNLHYRFGVVIFSHISRSSSFLSFTIIITSSYKRKSANDTLTKRQEQSNLIKKSHNLFSTH